jgi:predicted transcriptional regulator
MNGVLTLSRKEIDRLMILKQIEENKITVLEAADILELSQRQIYRILRRIKTEGSKGIIHKLRCASSKLYPHQK